MIFSDSAYTIGDSHKVCEDFAIHGSFETGNSFVSYGIVTDGCSSSLVSKGVRQPINVDLGARLLAMAARSAIKNLGDREKLTDNVNIEKMFENQVLDSMIDMRQSLSLPTDVFDATLVVVVWVQTKDNICPGKGWVAMYGDGAVAFEGYGDCKEIFTTTYESGAPYYLSYRLDNKKRAAYRDQFGSDKKTISRIFIPSEGEPTFEEDFTDGMPYWKPFWVIDNTKVGDEVSGENPISNPTSPNKYITVFSDGVESFYKQDGNGMEVLNSEAWLKDREGSILYPDSLSNFRGSKSFIQRRMNLLRRELRKSDPLVRHYDDLSCAGIFIDCELPK